MSKTRPRFLPARTSKRSVS